MKKRISALFLALVMCLSLSIPVFASDSLISEEDFRNAIENGTATIISESRDISTFTDAEINADPGLAELFASINQATPYTFHQYRGQGKLYRTTVILSTGDTAVYNLYPYCTLVVDDVPTAGSGSIVTSLKIVESITVNGEIESGWDNYIHLKNISVSMGCGKNTAFSQNIRVGGTTHESLLDTGSLLALLGTAISATEYTTVAAIISGFSAINYPSSSYTSSTAITNANVRAIGATWKSNLRLQNSDHELWAESSLSTKNSSLAANVSTYAATEWEYDIFYGVGSIIPQFSNVTLSASGSYLTNIK